MFRIDYLTHKELWNLTTCVNNYIYEIYKIYISKHEEPPHGKLILGGNTITSWTTSNHPQEYGEQGRTCNQHPEGQYDM